MQHSVRLLTCCGRKILTLSISQNDPRAEVHHWQLLRCNRVHSPQTLAVSDKAGFADRIYGISGASYSGLMPANLTTLPHFSASSTMSLPKSADGTSLVIEQLQKSACSNPWSDAFFPGIRCVGVVVL
jgi:hypothetical protein